MHPSIRRPPDFSRLQTVLSRTPGAAPVLFELFMNQPLYERLCPEAVKNRFAGHRYRDFFVRTHAFAAAGYHHVTVPAARVAFHDDDMRGQASLSINDSLLSGPEALKTHAWPDPDKADYGLLEELRKELPGGMKALVMSYDGVLENTVRLLGYEALCFALADNPEFVETVFNEVGRRLLRYYEIALSFDSVGGIIVNDDWGYKTQTLLAPEHIRRYVLPWHRRFVEVATRAGKPAILHSCGQLESVMDDIIAAGFAGKHSYEDAILPVEKAYEKYGSRIAVLGGIDVDFLCQATPARIRRRCETILEQTQARGGYALGSGNSIPAYVPEENWQAMVDVAIAAGG